MELKENETVTGEWPFYERIVIITKLSRGPNSSEEEQDAPSEPLFIVEELFRKVNPFKNLPHESDPNQNEGYHLPNIASRPKASIKSAFNNNSVRQGFVRKVYSILTVQLLLMTCIAALFYYAESPKSFTLDYWEIVFVALSVVLVCLGMIASAKKTKVYPNNYILLFAFTISVGYCLGFASAYLKSDFAVVTLGIGAVVCLVITAFSLQTKFCFTFFNGYLLLVFTLLCCFGALSYWYVVKGVLMHLVSICLGLLLFFWVLVLYTHMMIYMSYVPFLRRIPISPKDYIFAILRLYWDAVSIWFIIVILMFIVKCRKCPEKNNRV